MRNFVLCCIVAFSGKMVIAHMDRVNLESFDLKAILRIDSGFLMV